MMPQCMKAISLWKNSLIQIDDDDDRGYDDRGYDDRGYDGDDDDDAI